VPCLVEAFLGGTLCPFPKRGSHCGGSRGSRLGKKPSSKKTVELNESREFDDLINEEETERYKSGHWYQSKSEAPETAIIYCNRFLNALEECTMSGARQPKNARLV
jgi:hypothetical protein